MKIAVVGASGHVGKVLVEEAVSGGYEVTALVRDKSKADFSEVVKVVEVDLFNKEALVQAFSSVEVVISAYGPRPGSEPDLIAASRNLVDAAKAAKVNRLIAVGGAGGLLVAEGVRLVDTGNLPKEWLPIVDAHIEAIKIYEDEKELNWTVLKPAAFFESGERTGKFRIGKDYLIADSKGNSRISFQDYAIALFDELKKSEFIKSSFTIGY